MKEARVNYERSCIRPDEIDAMAACHEALVSLMYINKREVFQKVLISANKLLEREQALVKKIDELVAVILNMNLDRMNLGGRI